MVAIIRNPLINSAGRLYVNTGRIFFSAAGPFNVSPSEATLSHSSVHATEYLVTAAEFNDKIKERPLVKLCFSGL